MTPDSTILSQFACASETDTVVSCVLVVFAPHAANNVATATKPAFIHFFIGLTTFYLFFNNQKDSTSIQKRQRLSLEKQTKK